MQSVEAFGAKWARRVWDHPSALLLSVQVLGILVYPFMDREPLQRALFETFAIVVLAMVVRSIGARPWVVWSALGLGLIAGAMSITDALVPAQWLTVTSAVLHAFLYMATGGSLLRYMLRDQRVTSDELFAVGATFTVLAWAFAYVYVAAQAVQSGAFGDPEVPRTWMELLFLSVTTLTSTGLSDIVPVTVHARSMVMIEQIIGLGYVALVVSTIVGLTIRRARSSDGPDTRA